jgi:hypothetical protein
MSYITLRGLWYDIVLNVHAPAEVKGDDTKESFCEELESVFDQVTKDHMKLLLGDFSARIGRDDTFELTVGNESLHEIRHDYTVRVVNCDTLGNVIVKCTVFTLYSIHKYTWTCPDRKTQSD